MIEELSEVQGIARPTNLNIANPMPTTIDLATEEDKKELKKDGFSIKSDKNSQKEETIGDIIRSGIEDLRVTTYRPKVQRDDLDTMQERAIEYMERKAAEKRLPTIEGLAAWFGISRRTLTKWRDDLTNEATYEFLNIVSEIFSAMWAESAQTGSTNSLAWIFYAKNHFGYIDKNVVDVTGRMDVQEQPDEDAIRKRWLESGKDVKGKDK